MLSQAFCRGPGREPFRPDPVSPLPRPERDTKKAQQEASHFHTQRFIRLEPVCLRRDGIATGISWNASLTPRCWVSARAEATLCLFVCVCVCLCVCFNLLNDADVGSRVTTWRHSGVDRDRLTLEVFARCCPPAVLELVACEGPLGSGYPRVLPTFTRSA